MAYQTKISIFVLLANAVMLFTFLGKSAATIVTSSNITQITISGNISCSVLGNPTPGSFGVEGVMVTGDCNNIPGNLTTVITDPVGAFFIVMNGGGRAILFGPTDIPCILTILLPITNTNCTAFLPTGLLIAGVNVIQVVKTTAGGTLQLAASLFRPA